ncbi:MAG TPA: ZIP family metal transporter [Gemmatimonadales bacterium]|nr:ZIP family metal transporter [Gemmatimonadales bacterium]
MTPLLWAALAALGNLAGGLILVRRASRSMQLLEALVAFGAGFMLAVTLVEVMPEALSGTRENAAVSAVFLLAGYLAVHLAQHVLTPHFHFGEETHAISPMAGVTALIGLLLHTFFDGVAIASGFTVSNELGILLFAAVLVHKLPEGLAMASVMLAGGQSKQRAVGASALLGLATGLGVLVTERFQPLAQHGLALAAGVTLYVAASNLVPEFQGKKTRTSSAVAFFGGVGVFWVTRVLLGS